MKERGREGDSKGKRLREREDNNGEMRREREMKIAREEDLERKKRKWKGGGREFNMMGIL